MTNFILVMYVIITLCFYMVVPGIISGIVFTILSSKEIDQIKKAKYKKIMWWSFFGPICSAIGLTFLLLISRSLFLVITGV